MEQKTYYLLHYLENKDEKGKSLYSVSDVCETALTCFDRSRTSEHNEILNGRKSASTIGVKIGDGPIVDYVLGIEAIEGNEPDVTGKLVYDEAFTINQRQYERAYRQIVSCNRQIEFMNRQRYAVGIRHTVLASTQVKEEKTKNKE